jgi:adenine-specific DNA-methyltransferase
MSPNMKKRRVSVSLSKSTLEIVDMARAGKSRSAYIDEMIHPLTDQQREERRRNGAVYTPNFLAQFVAAKAVAYLLDDISPTRKGAPKPLRDLTALRFLDPACGDGELLCFLWKELITGLTARGYSSKVVDRLPTTALLCGLDIDAKAIAKTSSRIVGLRPHPKSRDSAKFLTTNALFPFNQPTRRGWEMIAQQFDAKDGFDIVVANPPWGADTASYKHDLINGDFSLHKGQFDTSDLFLELAVTIVRPGGIVAFIVPDSLFNRERTALRRLLLNCTQIKMIARLGEKIFDSVNRACAVIICKKAPASDDSLVECLRLTPEIRRCVLNLEMSLSQAQTKLGHVVPQSRFKENTECRFDIDTTAEEQEAIDILTRGRRTLRDFLISTRGMELSKSGRVCQCPNCNLWLPLPTKRTSKCIHCKSQLRQDCREESIVTVEPDDQLQRLLVGETVTRYLAVPKHRVDTRIEGVNFKEMAIYRSPKIVVRKTGVGISAALDLSGAVTNQVVYIMRNRDTSMNIPLEVFLAVLNSRAMYYYLVKTHGETEWRSHPYLTQTQILDFPMPDADWALPKVMRRTKRIAQLVRDAAELNTKVTAAADAEIESHVAALFGLSKQDYHVIYQTLDNVQQLLPVRELKRVDRKAIFPD